MIVVESLRQEVVILRLERLEFDIQQAVLAFVKPLQ